MHAATFIAANEFAIVWTALLANGKAVETSPRAMWRIAYRRARYTVQQMFD